MTDEIKKEAIEQLDLDIKFGFENESQLFDSIRDMFYNEDDFDDDWLRQAIAEKSSRHRINSSSWTRPTDFDRLAKAFDELISEKIVCLHKAGYTKQDGEGDCMETIEQLDELGIKAIGFCYYHTQDLTRAVDPEIRNLFLGFGTPTQNDSEAFDVATRIVDKLRYNGFDVHWTKSIDDRIEIVNIDWKKLPDNQEWGANRVISILTNSKKKTKPFWKLW